MNKIQYGDEPLPKERVVALRLMGLDPVCVHCVHWEAEGMLCKFRNRPRYLDHSCKHFEGFPEENPDDA
jgi:hypothetical protein